MNRMYVLDAVKMTTADEDTIDKLGIGQEVLMERAALAVADCVRGYHPKKVLCVCGSGNNGGDAVATARILKMQGIHADVYLCSELEKCKPSVQKQYDIFRNVGGRTVTDMNFREYDIIVDGILGVSLKPRNVEGFYEEVVGYINNAAEHGSVVIAVDIPTGIHTDTGVIMNAAVRAKETIAFAYYKPAHLLYPGAEYCGKVTVADIGIRYECIRKEAALTTFTVPKDEQGISLPERKRDGNKGTFGRILVIAGSSAMYGACYLAALSALRMGAGLVNIYTHEVNKSAIQNMLPEAILHTYSDDEIDKEELCKLMRRADCVVVGPGLSTNQTAMNLVKIVLEYCDKTIVADADALNCTALNPDWLDYRKDRECPEMIITPHPGELSGLTGMTVCELKEDYIGVVKKYAMDHRLVVVGKGAGTVVSDGNLVYINQSGNDGMATAGSGDVLSGIIAALCVNGENAFHAAWKGVFLHGKAGDYAAANMGGRSLIATDIVHSLPIILKEEDGF